MARADVIGGFDLLEQIPMDFTHSLRARNNSRLRGG
jgi:hypothetical protein